MSGTQKQHQAALSPALRHALRAVQRRIKRRRAGRLGAIGLMAGALFALAGSLLLIGNQFGGLPAWLATSINRLDLLLPMPIQAGLWLLLPLAALVASLIGLIWPVSRLTAARWADFRGMRSDTIEGAFEVHGPFAPLIQSSAAKQANRSATDSAIPNRVDREVLIALIAIVVVGLLQLTSLLMPDPEAGENLWTQDSEPMEADATLAGLIRDRLTRLAMGSALDDQSSLKDLLAQGQDFAEMIGEGSLTAGEALATQSKLLREIEQSVGSPFTQALLKQVTEDHELLESTRKLLQEEAGEIPPEHLQKIGEAFNQAGGEDLDRPDDQQLRELLRSSGRSNELFRDLIENKLSPERAAEQLRFAQDMQQTLREAGATLRGDQNARKALAQPLPGPANGGKGERIEGGDPTGEGDPGSSTTPNEQNPPAEKVEWEKNESTIPLTGERLRAKAADFSSRRTGLPADVREAAEAWLGSGSRESGDGE